MTRNTNADLPAALASLLSAGPAPDCRLEFKDGDLPFSVHAIMLQLASPVMHQAVQCAHECDHTLVVPVEGPGVESCLDQHCPSLLPERPQHRHFGKADKGFWRVRMNTYQSYFSNIT